MRRICVFTGTRADYGLLKPLLNQLKKNASFKLQIIASGMHLSPEFGLTHQAIEDDGFIIDEKVEMLLSSDSAVGICKSMGLGLMGCAESLQRLQPDLLIILGDRFEALSAATAAMINRIPIAHLHGGEVTSGVVDEAIRHAITKMSHLHFTSTEEYHKRVIQLGEDPCRVFNVGALGTENIRQLKLLSAEQLADVIGFHPEHDFILATFHPVTLENASAKDQFQSLLNALADFPKLKTIFTKANADTEGRVINKLIDSYTTQNQKNCKAFTSMGQLNYLSAMSYCKAVVGNSSSGIIEAPSFKVPTVNIGDRQKGRVRATCVIDCLPTKESISQAIEKSMSAELQKKTRQTINPYEKKGTAKNIIRTIEQTDLTKILKKEFYDTPLPISH